jgi:flagellar hook-associated protein 3 FlgL
MDDLQLTDEALGSLAQVTARAKELSMQAANGSLGAEQRQLLRAEIDGLRESMLLIANSRNSVGQALFGGQAPGLAYQDSGAGMAYVGTTTAESVAIGDGQSVTRAMTGPEVFSFDLAGTPSDMFAVLGALSLALQDPLADHAAAGRLAMGGVDAGLEKLATAQTIIGSRMGWIEIIDDRRVKTGELVADERASIGGADLATTMTRLQEVLSVLEASQASFVRLANLSLFDQLR